MKVGATAESRAVPRLSTDGVRARAATLYELLAFFVSVGPRRTVFEFYKGAMGTGLKT